MASEPLNLNHDLLTYLRSVGGHESNLQQELREETAKLPKAIMQISPEQGYFMHFLAKLAGVKRYLEVGVFTGYSTLKIAEAIPGNGEIIACDISEEWTSIAKRYWEAAGVGSKIQLILGPATETLNKLIKNPDTQSFDMAFIDADKENIDGYYEACLRLVRSGGLVLIDNTLWEGKVVDAEATDPETQAFRKLNTKLHSDPRIELCMMPIGDGLTVVMKK